MEDLTRVGGTGEGAFGHLQFDRASVARFFVVELGLVQIKTVQGLAGVVELHLRTDAVVVTNRGVAAIDIVHNLLAVDAELECQHYVGVVKRCFVTVCDKAEAVAHAGGTRDFEGRVLGQQRCRLGVYAVDDVHGAGLQCGGALVCILDINQLNTIKVATVGLPVVTGFALEGCTHTRLEFVEREGTSAIGLAKVFETIGHHDDVVVAQVVRQVNIALVHGDLHLGGRQLFDFLDVGQQSFGRRLGLAAVHIE